MKTQKNQLMVYSITNKISVGVRTVFQEASSNPDNAIYVHIYEITIANHGVYAVQLRRRFWKIIEGNGFKREVKGLGVVGEQPILEPGTSYTYVSACKIGTELGKMLGKFHFVRVADNHRIPVSIPTFVLCYPAWLN